MKKIKSFFLSLLLLFSTSCTTISLSMAPPAPPAAAPPGNSWLKKALWFLVPIVFHIVIKKILVAAVKKYYGNEFYDRARIRSLIKINQSLKQQLDYIKRNCKDKAIIKNMEEKYLHACIKLMELQKQYLDMYQKGAR